MLNVEKIQKWLEARGFTIPEEANCGECENFAMDFQADIPGSDLYGAEEFEGPDTEWAGHIWLYDGNLHYDSESPEGVADWKELKFYRRMATRKAWDNLCKEISETPLKHSTMVAHMPRDRDESSGIMRGTCDGIYPIRRMVISK